MFLLWYSEPGEWVQKYRRHLTVLEGLKFLCLKDGNINKQAALRLCVCVCAAGLRNLVSVAGNTLWTVTEWSQPFSTCCVKSKKKLVSPCSSCTPWTLHAAVALHQLRWAVFTHSWETKTHRGTSSVWAFTLEKLLQRSCGPFPPAVLISYCVKIWTSCCGIIESIKQNCHKHANVFPLWVNCQVWWIRLFLFCAVSLLTHLWESVSAE